MDFINPRLLTDIIMGSILGFTFLFVPFHNYVTSKKNYLYGLIFNLVYSTIVTFGPLAIRPPLSLFLFYIVLTIPLKRNIVQGIIGSILALILVFFTEVFLILLFPLLFDYPMDLVAFGNTTHWQVSFYSHALMIIFALGLGLLLKNRIPNILKPFEQLKKIHIIGSLIILGGFISYLFYFLVFNNALDLLSQHTIVQIFISFFFLSLLLFFSYLHYQYLMQVREKEEMLSQAEKDFLSKGYYRGPGLRYAKEQLRLCQERKIPITFGFLDLNDLKIINDEYGHDEGDRYIKDLSEMVLKNIRAADLFIRYGGDEFMFVLPGATKEKALDLQEKVNQGLSQQGDDLPYPRSFSIGIYEASFEEEIDLDKILKIVDHKMYIDKKVYKSNRKGLFVGYEGDQTYTETPLPDL